MQGNKSPDGKIDLSLQVVERVYSYLSSIDFCACRAVDIELHGWTATVTGMRRHISKNMEYLKEWAELRFQAVQWESGGRKRSLLLSGDKVPQWTAWCRHAAKYCSEPPPSKQQLDFVDASGTASNKRMQWHLLTVFALILLITGLSVAAMCTAVKSGQVSRLLAGSFALAAKARHLL